MTTAAAEDDPEGVTHASMVVEYHEVASHDVPPILILGVVSIELNNGCGLINKMVFPPILGPLSGTIANCWRPFTVAQT